MREIRYKPMNAFAGLFAGGLLCGLGGVAIHFAHGGPLAIKGGFTVASGLAAGISLTVIARSRKRDNLALRFDNHTVHVKTTRGMRQVPWSQVGPVELRERRIYNQTIHEVVVRVYDGKGGFDMFAFNAASLDGPASNVELAALLETARLGGLDEPAPRKAAAYPALRRSAGFGRRGLAAPAGER